MHVNGKLKLANWMKVTFRADPFIVCVCVGGGGDLECRSDGDCPSNAKCCPNGCGKECAPPISNNFYLRKNYATESLIMLRQLILIWF